MIPILYDTINEGTVPSHFGIGALTDTLAASVNEERNGSFELSLTYAAQGIHADEIKVGRYIKAKPNFTDDAQLFRIYQVGKAMNGRFEVSAEHVSYLLSGKPITSGTANNCASACAVLSAQAGNFTISTTKTTAGDFAITAPSSVRSWFGGKTGSLLDVYGGGEWHYNNFTCTLKEHRGVVTPIATIRYKKNLTEFNQEIDASNLYTHVLCYYQADATKVVGNEVATGLSGTKRVLILDKTSDYQITPDVADLDNDATTYIASHNLTTPESNFTLNFVQSGQLFDRVDLCDMVNVYFEPLGITATVKCIRVKWDVLKGRYIETEFGTPKSNITDTLADNNKAIAEAESAAAEAINQVGSKKRVFISTPVPPYDVGDLWTDSNDLYFCTNPRTQTVIGETSGAVANFEALIDTSLLECTADIVGSQSGAGTPSTLNPRPLTAYNSATITRTGKNLFVNNKVSSSASGVTFTTNDDGTIELTGTATATVFILPMGSTGVFFPAGTYTMKASGNAGIQMLLRENNTSGNDAIRATTVDVTRTLTAGNYATLIRIASGTVTDGITLYPQMEVGSASTAYEPYNPGETYTIDFGAASTIYKGTLNVTTGELTVTHKVITRKWSEFGNKTNLGNNTRGSLYITSEGKGKANNPTDLCTVAPYKYKYAEDSNHFYIDLSGDNTALFAFMPNGTDGDTNITVAYELATPATYQLGGVEIAQFVGTNNIWSDTNGNVSVRYYADGFTMSDWELATDYVGASTIETAIAEASDVITGTAGGFVVWHDSNNDGQPDEILIMDTANIDTATKVWRWNAGGLAYSPNGYAGPYNSAAITSTGQINASSITTGNLDASQVTIQNLTATMFKGGKLTLGGLNNQAGVFELLNDQGIVIGEMNKGGLKFYGDGPIGARPYVVLNNSDGLKGYDANDTAIFWVNRDEFTMKKCVAQNEINACNKIKFVPVTIRDGNNDIVNDGVAIVGIVQN